MDKYQDFNNMLYENFKTFEIVSQEIEKVVYLYLDNFIERNKLVLQFFFEKKKIYFSGIIYLINKISRLNLILMYSI